MKILSSFRKNTYVLSIVKLLEQNQSLALTIFFIAVIAESLFPRSSSDLVIFSLLALYIALARFYGTKSKLTFLFCIVLLILMYGLFLTTGTSVATEKVAVWLVLFILVGIIQQWRET